MFDQLFGKSAPNLNVAPLDSGTQQLITGMANDAGQSDSQISDKHNAGVAAAGNQALQSDTQGNQEAARTGQNSAMLSAIRNQYNGIAGDQINNVMKSNEMNAPLYRAQMLDMAVKARFAQKQVDNQNYTKLMEANTNAEMARASTLYGILSGAGNVAGAYVGSRMGGGRRRQSGPVAGFNMPSMGSQYEMNNYGGPNTFGGAGMASRFGG